MGKIFLKIIQMYFKIETGTNKKYILKNISDDDA